MGSEEYCILPVKVEMDGWHVCKSADYDSRDLLDELEHSIEVFRGRARLSDEHEFYAPHSFVMLKAYFSPARSLAVRALSYLQGVSLLSGFLSAFLTAVNTQFTEADSSLYLDFEGTKDESTWQDFCRAASEVDSVGLDLLYECELNRLERAMRGLQCHNYNRLAQLSGVISRQRSLLERLISESASVETLTANLSSLLSQLESKQFILSDAMWATAFEGRVEVVFQPQQFVEFGQCTYQFGRYGMKVRANLERVETRVLPEPSDP